MLAAKVRASIPVKPWKVAQRGIARLATSRRYLLKCHVEAHTCVNGSNASLRRCERAIAGKRNLVERGSFDVPKHPCNSAFLWQRREETVKRCELGPDLAGVPRYDERFE